VNKLIPSFSPQGLFAIALLLVNATAFAEDKKQIGQRLFESAQNVSDIRADGAPAFRMEGRFRIIPKSPAKETEGKFTEIWLSRVKWRREVETPTFHWVEIGSSPNKYHLESGSDRPDSALSDPLILLFPKTSPEIKGISQREVSGVTSSCVESKGLESKVLDCVDPATGVFLFRETHFRFASQACWYRDYQKFGERSFPRSVHCTKKPGDEIELTISRISAETSREESMFAKPSGSIEVANCQGRLKPPKLVNDPEPKYPEPRQEEKTVLVSVVVGVEGKPQDLRVTNSGGTDFDQSALDAIQLWTFKPATCDGVPAPAIVSVQVNFRKR
jgi:TonB family protein